MLVISGVLKVAVGAGELERVVVVETG